MNTLPYDTLTLTTALVIVLLGILTPMLSPFFRFTKKKDDNHDPNEEQQPAPPVSIILTPYDDADKLEKNLPPLLQQHYPAGYQIVIVIEQGDHNAEDLIARTLHGIDRAQTNAEVYITRFPKTSRYVSKKKLALTLGIKAAKHNRLLLTEAACRPASPYWLALMTRHCDDNHNLVVGYEKYDENTSSFRRFVRTYNAFYLMREYTKGTAYRACSHNLLMRKDEFMENGGFLGNLHLVRGEYDFLVNKYARKGGTALETDSRAWMIEDVPSGTKWRNRHLYYMESRKFLSRSAEHRLPFIIDQVGLHLTNLLLIAGTIYGSAAHCRILFIASVATLHINMIIRFICYRRALNSFGERILPLKALVYEYSLIWWHLAYMIRYRLADKNDFTTHKL